MFTIIHSAKSFFSTSPLLHLQVASSVTLMMISSVFILIATSALGCMAAPAPQASVPDSTLSNATAFSVPAITNPTFIRNGPAALLKAYGKYGLTPTKDMPAISAALSKRQNGQVAAIPYQGVEYLCSVNIGGQTFNLDFDTGSSDLWVFSSLQSAASRSGHDFYTSSKSSTYKALSGYTWKISYGDGSGASGSVGTDTVTIGSTIVKNQAIELASQVSSSFTQDGSDGLVGLAFSNINTVKPVQQKTFFDNAAPSLSAKLFAAYLPFGKTGAYDFGFIDTAKYSGTVNYAAVSSSGGFWEYPSTSYKVGTKTYTSAGRTSISDTGTTLILMGDDAVDNYYAAVSGATYSSSQGGYIFPCSATLPSLSIRIGTTAYATIPPKLMNYGNVDNTNCFGSLQSVGSGTQNIYGDVFFNAYYGIFDASGPRFGFAPVV